MRTSRSKSRRGNEGQTVAIVRPEETLITSRKTKAGSSTSSPPQAKTGLPGDFDVVEGPENGHCHFAWSGKLEPNQIFLAGD